jgi:hypothetical protein
MVAPDGRPFPTDNRSQRGNLVIIAYQPPDTIGPYQLDPGAPAADPNPTGRECGNTTTYEHVCQSPRLRPRLATISKIATGRHEGPASFR